MNGVSSNTNGICRFLQGDCIFGKECKFGHPERNLSLFISRAESEAAPLLCPLSLRETYGEPVAHIGPERSNDMINDYADPNMIDSISRDWKTTPCRHYIRTQGWCPVGEKCRFIHDLTLQPSEYINGSWGLPSRFGNGMHEISHTAPLAGNPSGGKTKPPKSHCWSHVQNCCDVQHCQYFHPQDIRPYLKYTPCLLWLDCVDRTNCSFKHPAEIPDRMTPGLSPTTGPILPVYYPPIEVNGTTYFDLAAQIKLYDSGLTMPPQDSLFYGDQTNVTPLPPPPPSSPFHQSNQNPKFNNSQWHSMLNDQRLPRPPQTRRQDSHTRISAAFSGDEAADKENDDEDDIALYKRNYWV